MHPFATCGRVLSVSDHEGIRMSRELLLRSAGYSVISLTSDGVSKEELPSNLEIAIIGQTVDDPTASRMAANLHRTPSEYPRASIDSAVFSPRLRL